MKMKKRIRQNKQKPETLIKQNKAKQSKNLPKILIPFSQNDSTTQNKNNNNNNSKH